MSEFAIQVESLGKKYHIGAKKEKYMAFRDVLARSATAPFRRAKELLRGHAYGAAGLDEVLWALDNVSFEVRPGEVVGIIGRNGAGKSTLLKVLSRITEPTRGRVTITGRIGALLEVSTGFHPELTGRENVYLNASILGMKKKEVDKKFDEIVAFAEVEKFIDTPVKHYSSGMGTRLGFAVAAHLEPEILLVDEVLAVGDAAFQRKCLGKMQAVSEEGRTVLFVSHNMSAITRLCERTILLDAGRVVADGRSHEVVKAYLGGAVGSTAERVWDDPKRAPGNNIVRIRAVRVRTQEGRVAEGMDIRQPVVLEMEYDVLQPGHDLVPRFRLTNEEGLIVFITHDITSEWYQKPKPIGHYISTALIPGNFLSEGNLVVTVAIWTNNPIVKHALERDAVAFHIMDTMEGDSARGDFGREFPGVVRPLLQWNTQLT